MRTGWRRALTVAVAITALGSCGSDSGSSPEDPITVGAVTFAENQLVAEMYAQVLIDEGFDVDRRLNFQDRETLEPALESGSVDVVPEYLASLLTFLDSSADVSSDAAENVDSLSPLLAERDLELLEPSDANDTNAIVVTDDTAKRLDLKSVTDLMPHGDDLVLGGPPECPVRFFCLQGLREIYGLEFERFQALDAGGPLTIAALDSGEIDVALLFTTSAVIEQRGWVVLRDDKKLQAAENVTPVIRSEFASGAVEDRLNEVSDALTTQNITQLNGQVELENRDFREVARAFLKAEGLVD